jgi:hypothetical protein
MKVDAAKATMVPTDALAPSTARRTRDLSASNAYATYFCGQRESMWKS